MIEDISSAVLNINVPTLVLAGENDQVERVATLEQELFPRIRDAQMKVIPRSGHLSLLEVPDEIAAGIGLCDEVRPGSAAAGHPLSVKQENRQRQHAGC